MLMPYTYKNKIYRTKKLAVKAAIKDVDITLAKGLKRKPKKRGNPSTGKWIKSKATRILPGGIVQILR